MKRFFTQLLVCALVISLFAACAASTPNDATSENPAGTTGTTAPSIYAQQGKCRNHAAFSTLKTIKQPL